MKLERAALGLTRTTVECWHCNVDGCGFVQPKLLQIERENASSQLILKTPSGGGCSKQQSRRSNLTRVVVRTQPSKVWRKCTKSPRFISHRWKNRGELKEMSGDGQGDPYHGSMKLGTDTEK